MVSFRYPGIILVPVLFIILRLVYPAYNQDTFVVLEEDTDTQVSTEDDLLDLISLSESGIEIDDNTPFSRLPGTSLRPHNILLEGEKGLIYSPSGGYNNQLAEFAAALGLAKRYNRSLLVPMVMRHSDFWNGYEALDASEGLPFDHCVDFAVLNTSVPLVPLNMTMRDFMIPFYKHKESLYRTNKRVGVFSVTVNSQGSVPGLAQLDDFVSSNAQVNVLVVRKSFFRFLGKKGVREMRAEILEYGNILPTPYIRQVSVQLTHAMFGEGQPFYSMHVRLGDFAIQGFVGGSLKYLSRAVSAKWPKNSSVYVASEPGFDQAFIPFKKYFPNMVLGTDLLKNKKAQRIIFNFGKRLPRNHIRVDVFGLVEAWMCTLARDFIGNVLSTFSETIIRQRQVFIGTQNYSTGFRINPGWLEKEDKQWLRRARIPLNSMKINSNTKSNGKSKDLPVDWEF